ncbi:Homeobox-leucine zipper protein HDG12 [Capsicum chinense]|nr:Homeobox-leucine zipper protein HDG12 [Capsicum chinense]
MQWWRSYQCMMKVAQRMASSFYVSTSLSNGQQWNNISTLDEFEVRATLQKCTDSGHPNGIVISAASPIPPLHVFNFLRDERTRSQRDVLFNQNSIQEVAHIANDSHPGNSIFVLRAWFRELPSGLLDSLSPRQLRCHFGKVSETRSRFNEKDQRLILPLSQLRNHRAISFLCGSAKFSKVLRFSKLMITNDQYKWLEKDLTNVDWTVTPWLVVFYPSNFGIGITGGGKMGRQLKEAQEKLKIGKRSSEFVMCLHVVSALNCRIRKYNEAIPHLERSIEIPDLDMGQNHALAKFTGCMHLGIAMEASGHEAEVTAAIDCNIGEVICAYQKAFTVFKSTKGKNHRSVASVNVRLADMYNKIGKFRESKSYCENALQIVFISLGI